MTETRKKRARRTMMVAAQDMFYENRIVKEGEVFLYVGSPLPAERVCVKAPAGARVGVPLPESDEPPPKEPPAWTTPGFVERAGRAAGRDEAEEYDE